MNTNQLRILVNYADVDNQAQKGKPGWVESFSYVLKMMVAQILKSDPQILMREDVKEAEPGSGIDVIINVYSDGFDKGQKREETSDSTFRSKQSILCL